MSHVFIAPHPDDVALSCGGLIASLRELGQNVAIVTVFSGSGSGASLSSYQREALGFGSKALWPNSEAFNRAAIGADYPDGDGPDVAPPWAAEQDRLDATQEDADAAAKRFWQRSSWYRRASIRNKPLAGQALIDDVPTQGAVMTDELVEAAAAGDIMARRRVEDERFAYFAEAAVVFLDLPDAVFRGYEGDDELLGSPRLDDDPPLARIRREIARLEPQTVYVPLGVGNHVDHQLCREVGVALAGESRSWVMPGPEWAGNVVFYEDFPYAWWSGFDRLEQLPDGALDGLGRGVLLTPEYADVTDQLERKIRGVALYESQLDRLFGGEREMAAAIRAHGAKTAELGRRGGAAERYWHTLRA
jgi:LmbE family N-acetylglucosaminyl deacetylase